MKKWLSGLILCVTGCGAELDRSSEVETLRVLGVHKSQSYARAGEDVTFSMLWHDPKEREIAPVWFAVREDSLALLAQFGGVPASDSPWDPESDALLPLCANPPRDSYFGCLGYQHGMLRATADQGLDGLEALTQEGSSLTLRVPQSTVEVRNDDLPGSLNLPASSECNNLDGVPDDAVSCSSIYHPAPDTDNLPNFGSMFVFFALCPGSLTYDPSVTESGQGFGMLCLDQEDEPLGSDDFVFGYSQIYLYEDFENQNPIVTGMLVAGEASTASCIGVECLEETDERPSECEDGVPCLDVCTEADEDDCPEVDIKPIISRSTVEQDEVAQIAYGRSQTEQMWVRYYSDRGRVASEVRLLNDSITGWNPDYGTQLRLPQEPGPIRIWAVVYDNRGGQDWVRVDAVVE